MGFRFGGTLTDMNSRVLLLVDLHNDSIKKIVRDTAATQFAPIQLSNEKPVARKSIERIEFVVPVAVPAPKYPTRLPDPAPRSTGFLSTQIDTLLDVDDDPSLEGKYPIWLSCQARDDLKSATQQDACPSAYPKDLRHAIGY
jgi:hypothetical protein